VICYKTSKNLGLRLCCCCYSDTSACIRRKDRQECGRLGHWS